MVPRLPAPVRLGEFASPHGLLEAVVDRLLAEAATALQLPEPGRSVRTLESDPTSLLREAGDRFCSAITLATGDRLFQGVFDLLNAISSLRYEGAACRGRIVFVPKSSKAVSLDLSLATPISLRNAKLARKVVEMSSAELCCICNGRSGFSALGRLTDRNAPDAIWVDFVGHYRWDLYYQERLVMNVAHGVPRLPVARLGKDDLERTVARLFPAMSNDSRDALWSIVEAAMEQGHGTMLVVSSRAQKEAARLSTQALPVQPTRLARDVVTQVTAIDGAVLLDCEATCHAVGVILDGTATKAGDPARGARYNSALRYVNSTSEPTMCVVVSEDGYVDLVSRRPPQIARRDIAARIDDLEHRSIDDYMKAYSWLDEHRFYLTEEECKIVNRELERIQSAPMELGEIRLSILAFVPDPEMNDSYYLPEPKT